MFNLKYKRKYGPDYIKNITVHAGNFKTEKDAIDYCIKESCRTWHCFVLEITKV